jgi:hypothetical protein
LPVPPGYDRARRLQRGSRKRAAEAAGERIDVGVAEALLDDLDERVPGDAERIRVDRDTAADAARVNLIGERLPVAAT